MEALTYHQPQMARTQLFPKMRVISALISVIFFLLYFDVVPCEGASLVQPGEHKATDIQGSFSKWPLGVLVGSLAVLVCGLLLIMGCADLCQKHAGFKDFDNDVFSTEDPVVPAPASEFTMYPPAENTPDSISATPVVFEPLPDITTRVQQRQNLGNAWRLRPRVIHDAQERSESVDSLDEAVLKDSVQEKMRLQNLLTNSRQQVPRGQLQYIKELGNGWFGKVLQGEGHGILPGHKKTKVVIQMLKEETDTQDQLAFLEEATPYRDTDHPNVMKLLGQCVDTAPFLNVLELCPFGDLKTYLRSHRVAMESFNEKGLLLKFACDMAAGLQALHQEGFIHRDFATRNCLLASDLSVKIGDYGVSEELFKEDYHYDSRGDTIPVRWLPPESLFVSQGDVYLRRITKESNIWSYGVALWETITFGSLPYGDLSNQHVIRLVIMEKSVKLPKPDVNVTNLDRLYQLLQLCWEEPENRPSLREMRIMLLHLMARKDEVNQSAFEMKWNQLMPRRSPHVTRVARPDGFVPATLQPNGSVRMGSGDGSINKVGPSIPAAGTLPSVLIGEDLDSSISELNASKIGLAGSLNSLSKLGDQPTLPVAISKPPPPTSPVNEMSLEAEFSAANIVASTKQSAEDTNEKKSEHMEAAGKGLPDSGQESETKTSSGQAEVVKENKIPEKPDDVQHLSPDENILSPIKSDESHSQSGEHPDNLTENNDSDTDSPKISESSKEVFTNESVADSAPPTNHPVVDFVTSTPKKVETDTDTELYLTAQEGSAVQTNSEVTQPTGTFHTAQSYSTQSSVERSLSLEYEDRSFLAPNKFADLLQTVAMTSIDDEMLDSSCEASPLPSDLMEEDVFKSAAATSDGIAQNQTEDDQAEDEDIFDVLDESESGEDTPRNTPTPPLATSRVPLLDVSEVSLGGTTESQQLVPALNGDTHDESSEQTDTEKAD